MVEEFHSRGASQVDQRAESDIEPVSITTGSGSATVNFDEPFPATPHSVQLTLGDGIDGDVSYSNLTQSSVDINISGSNAADGSYDVSWRVVGPD